MLSGREVLRRSTEAMKTQLNVLTMCIICEKDQTLERTVAVVFHCMQQGSAVWRGLTLARIAVATYSYRQDANIDLLQQFSIKLLEACASTPARYDFCNRLAQHWLDGEMYAPPLTAENRSTLKRILARKLPPQIATSESSFAMKELTSAGICELVFKVPLFYCDQLLVSAGHVIMQCIFREAFQVEAFCLASVILSDPRTDYTAEIISVVIYYKALLLTMLNRFAVRQVDRDMCALHAHNFLFAAGFEQCLAAIPDGLKIDLMNVAQQVVCVE